MEASKKNRKHIVIVGGGFAGLNLARGLFNNSYFQVTLVDKNNYNYFTPLLYQVATSFLEPTNISYPFRELFKDKAISFIMATVLKIDAKLNKLYLTTGMDLSYDYLVVAAGTKTNFFNNETFEQNTLPLKDINDALFIRNEMIDALEKASVEKDPLEKQRWLRIVIAGGGPTGVELAGMITELKDLIFRQYPEMKKCLPEVYIIDPSPRLLAAMSAKSSRDAHRVLSGLGVRIRLNTSVRIVEKGKVYLSDGTSIEAKTIIWAAGVAAVSFEGIALESVGRGGRILTNQYNKVLGYENIYAIGDISIQLSDVDYPMGHPQLAQPAIQQGRALAANLMAIEKGKSMKPFKYVDRGDLAIIGKTFAVADLFKNRIHIKGLSGLLVWLLVHLMYLVNYNNKIKTIYNWAIAYITSDQALRMIFRTERRMPVSKPQSAPKQNSLI